MPREGMELERLKNFFAIGRAKGGIDFQRGAHSRFVTINSGDAG
jgi:hypothetical protein